MQTRRTQASQVEMVALTGGTWASILAQAILEADRDYPIEGATVCGSSVATVKPAKKG